MSATLSYELDKLFQHAVACGTKEFNTKGLYDILSKFRHMSPFNTALVYIQKPGSVFVASA
ncbi:MAG: hypothetical protein K2J88_02810 [Oscillospiraceae bacterium]|nr:hypothetical protein [Oscillospiraceae bacterium]